MENNSILAPDIQLFADEGGGSAATSEPTPAAGAPGAIGATDDGNGTQAVTRAEAKPFKSFASEADYQKEVDFRVQQALKTHEEKLKGKLTPEIRKQLEAEANMTAEQKVQAQLSEIATQKSEISKERNRIKAESLFVKSGITDEVTRSTILDSVVTADETETLKRAQTIIEAIGKATNEKIKAAMKDVKKPGSEDPAKSKGEKNEAITIAENIAKRHAEAAKESSRALDYYIKH